MINSTRLSSPRPLVPFTSKPVETRAGKLTWMDRIDRMTAKPDLKLDLLKPQISNLKSEISILKSQLPSPSAEV
jgi:hypothetical protein